MPGLVNDVTRIWELNLYWPVNSQCGIWDPRGKGVDIWECIHPREYTFSFMSYPLLDAHLNVIGIVPLLFFFLCR